MKLDEFLKTKPTSESDEQKAVVEYLRALSVPFFAVPNGGARAKKYAARLKREGVVSGVPDLIIVQPSPKTGKMVALEMKSKTGVLSKNQKIFIPIMEQHGWIVLVAQGAAEAVRLLREVGF